MKSQSGYEVFVPLLGKDNPAHDPRPRDVIAEAGQSGTGNSVLRVGQVLASGGWTQTAYLVLSPADRERLIEALMEHRAQAPGAGGVSERFSAEETEELIIAAGEAVCGGGAVKNVLSPSQIALAERAYQASGEF